MVSVVRACVFQSERVEERERERERSDDDEGEGWGEEVETSGAFVNADVHIIEKLHILLKEIIE